MCDPARAERVNSQHTRSIHRLREIYEFLYAEYSTVGFSSFMRHDPQSFIQHHHHMSAHHNSTALHRCAAVTLVVWLWVLRLTFPSSEDERSSWNADAPQHVDRTNDMGNACSFQPWAPRSCSRDGSRERDIDWSEASRESSMGCMDDKLGDRPVEA